MIRQSARKIEEFGKTSLSLGVSLRDKLVMFWRFTKNIRVQAGLGEHHPDNTYRLRTRYGTGAGFKVAAGPLSPREALNWRGGNAEDRSGGDR